MGAFKDMAIEQQEREQVRGNQMWVEVYHEVELPGGTDTVEVTASCLVTMHRADRMTGDPAYGEVEDMRFSFECADEHVEFVIKAMQDDSVVESLSWDAVERAIEEGR